MVVIDLSVVTDLIGAIDPSIAEDLSIRADVGTGYYAGAISYPATTIGMLMRRYFAGAIKKIISHCVVHHIIIIAYFSAFV